MQEIDLLQCTASELTNLKFQAALLWKEYFKNFNTKYTRQYDILLDEEQKNTIKYLTNAYLEYKYNPAPTKENKLWLVPGYKYTDNKNEINLMTLSLQDVFAM